MAESLFTSQVPANLDAADGNTIVTATVVRFATAGTVTGIRWWGPTVVGVTCKGGLFTITGESTGAELARANFGAVTGGAWNTTTFSSPVDVAANAEYVAAVWSDHYVATSNFFATALTNGNITGIADSAPFRNGRFLFPAADLAFPPSTFGKACYFVDVLFLPTITAVLTLACAAPTLSMDGHVGAVLTPSPVSTTTTDVAALTTATDIRAEVT